MKSRLYSIFFVYEIFCSHILQAAEVQEFLVELHFFVGCFHQFNDFMGQNRSQDVEAGGIQNICQTVTCTHCMKERMEGTHISLNDAVQETH